MNVEEILFRRVPALYFLRTSGKFKASYNRNRLEGIKLGYEGVYARVETEKSEEKKKGLFGQLIKLKESDKLYLVSEGTLKTTHLDTHVDRITTTFYLPPKAPPGKYRVSLFGLRNSDVSLLGNQTLVLEKTGLTAYLSSLIISHGLTYGIIAVIIAIISGLAVGIIFSSKGSH